jgi:Ca-activated chloride channel family protein
MILDASWVTDQQRAGAADFANWVRESDQQDRFTAAGFRTFDGRPGDTIRPEDGLLPEGPQTVISPPAPQVLADVQSSWDELRKRASVLMVMDVSGSMSQPVAGGTRLSLAQTAAREALDAFAKDDEVGLWAFSTDLGRTGQPYRELVPVGPAAQTIPKMKQDIDSLVADGGTALYATLRDAQKASLQDLDTERINAIVLLSDGRNEYPPDTDLDSLLRQVEGESVDTSVRIFTIGYGDSADSASLTAIADASRGQYYEATDPASIEKVMVSVLSNF